MQAKLVRTISLLEENGTELREPFSKPLGDGIFELRAKVGTDISCVLYFFVINRQAILTHGFIKKNAEDTRCRAREGKTLSQRISQQGGKN